MQLSSATAELSGISHGMVPLTIPFVEIAAALHQESGFPKPWSAAEFSDLLNMPGAAGLLAMAGDAPAGLIVWRCAADEAEILTICTLPQHRRLGIGRFLLESVEAILQKTGIRELFLEVAVDNLAAGNLYRMFGFQKAGYRPAYYKTIEGAIDAYIFSKKI